MLAFVPAAAGREVAYRGKLEGGGTVRFEQKIRDDGTRKIARWRWYGLPITCDAANGFHNGFFTKPWLRVKNRAFRATRISAEYPDGRATVIGGFPRTWKRAEGTFRVSGTTYVGTNCESGAVYWRARRIRR